MKERLDVLLVQRGLATSREKAKAIIMSGNVFVEGQREDKAGTTFADTVNIEVKGSTLKYVSRGGLKLEKAMANFQVSVEGKVCTDVGSSTGGFTEYMLSRGAKRVYAVDVGHGQLAEKLRNDNRVVNAEGMDIRELTEDFFGGKADFICTDVSFISLTKILPKIKELLAEGAVSAVLIKPQFEAGKSSIGKNGIVKDRKVHERVLAEIDETAVSLGLHTAQYTYSPIKGGSGNTEYLVKLINSDIPRKAHDFRELTERAMKEL